jgi:uncharacterized protein (TIGR03083 family)
MSRPRGTKEFWLAGLRAEGAAFRAAAGQEGALQRPVPSCPGWTVQDLVGHVAGTYAMVAGLARRGVTRPPEWPPAATTEKATTSTATTGTTAAPDPLAWWNEHFTRLITLFDGLDPAFPAWNWAPQPKRAEFWYRRMAHETAVHRWDAQLAVGQCEPIEAKLAADGVTEVIDSWLPAGKRKGPVDQYGVVALRATDVEEVWDVRLRGQDIALLDTDTLLDDDHHERATATGTASDLLLALYGRITFDMLDVSGDRSLLEALRTG